MKPRVTNLRMEVSAVAVMGPRVSSEVTTSRKGLKKTSGGTWSSVRRTGSEHTKPSAGVHTWQRRWLTKLEGIRYSAQSVPQGHVVGLHGPQLSHAHELLASSIPCRHSPSERCGYGWRRRRSAPPQRWYAAGWRRPAWLKTRARLPTPASTGQMQAACCCSSYLAAAALLLPY
jgi:hypothetical protein